MIGDEVNLIGMLLDSGIPVMSRDRTEKDPIIIRGGASSFNPSVIMDVCDLFFIGEGEGVLAELLRMIQKGIADGLSREEILLAAVKTWDCLWAPRFYEQRFDETGKLLGMAAEAGRQLLLFVQFSRRGGDHKGLRRAVRLLRFGLHIHAVQSTLGGLCRTECQRVSV